VVALVIYCFSSCKKLFRNIFSIVIMTMLRFCCCLFPCDFCRKWEFYILVEWFCYYCFTDFEVDMILTRLDNIYASVSVMSGTDESVELFVNTLMAYYRTEYSKCMKENIRSVLLEKIIRIITNISYNEESQTKSANYLFNYLKNQDMNYDIDVILCLARLFSRVQNNKWSGINVLVKLSKLNSDYPVKIICETVKGIILFDKHFEWPNVYQLQLSIIKASGDINLTINAELIEIVNETIKSMCSIKQMIPEDSLPEFLKILQSLVSFVIPTLSCSNDLMLMVNDLKSNRCKLKEISIIEDYLEGKYKKIIY
jgi:hypothetical protein